MSATRWWPATRRGSRSPGATSRYFPSSFGRAAAARARAGAGAVVGASIRELIPPDENKPFDMRELIDALVDEGSLLEIHAALGARS